MRPLVFFAACITCFHFLFWHETLGINLFLFSLGVLAYSFFHKVHDELKLYHYLLIAFTIASGLSVILLNTAFSKYTFVLCTIASHVSLQTKYRSVYEFLFNGVINFLNPFSGLIPGFKVAAFAPKSKTSIVLRILILPLAIFSLYIILFSFGNSIFGELSNNLFGDFTNFLSDLFSLTYTPFLFLAIIIARWVIRKKWFTRFQIAQSDNLIRNRRDRQQKYFRIMGLKHEFFMVLTLFSLLNVLYLVVNFIDVKWLWFQFNINEVESLKDLVHKGVGWLIFTLLVSIFIISFYFRKNLNFYPKNKPLKLLAYAWIAQNAILTISVVIRTIYYVQYHGLASKRIGVFIFLIVVFFGLITLVYKIWKCKNFAFLLRTNSLFILGLLCLTSLFPWNIITARFNLKHDVVHQIHVDNYLHLDPQVYPIIYQNLDKIEHQINSHQNNNVRWIRYDNIEAFKTDLASRSRHYLTTNSRVSWASWSYADQQAIQALSEIQQTE